MATRIDPGPAPARPSASTERSAAPVRPVLAVLASVVALVGLSACASTSTGPPPGLSPELHDVSYGPSSSNVADIYPATTGDGPRPVVIWVHGGGWTIGSKADVPAGIVALRDEGFAVVSIDYRLSPGVDHPDHVLDVKRAISWVEAVARERNFDPANVFVAGHSAGGHLSMLAGFTRGVAGLDAGEPPVRGVIAIASPVTLNSLYGLSFNLDMSLRMYVGCDGLSLDRCDVSAGEPNRYLDAGDPPLLLQHSTDDEVVPVSQARSMAAMAAAAGMDVQLDELSGAHLSTLAAAGGPSLSVWLLAHLTAADPSGGSHE